MIDHNYNDYIDITEFTEYEVTEVPHRGRPLVTRGTIAGYVIEAYGYAEKHDMVFNPTGSLEEQFDQALEVLGDDLSMIKARRCLSEVEILEWLACTGEQFSKLSTNELAKLTGDLIREGLIEENETAFDIINSNARVFSDDQEFPEDVREYIEDSSDYIELFDHIVWNRG